MPTPANFSLAALLLGLSITPTSTAFGADYSDWYQVEVIIFANKTPVKTDEIWPVVPLNYPEEMVSITPHDRPFSVEQVSQLEGYLALFKKGTDEKFNANGEQPQIIDSNEFLFQSRSRLQAPAEFKVDTPDMDDLAMDNDLAVAIDYEALFQSDAPQAFAALPEERRILNSQARSIRRSSLYQTLVHKSWLQPIAPDKVSFPVLIQAGAHFDDMYELDGTITISRSRFLHVDTDLWFTEFTPLYQQGEAPVSTAANLLAPELREKYPEVANWESTKGQYLKVHSHQLRQSRRMRSSTLHFIDHPRFGILVKIEGFNESNAD